MPPSRPGRLMARVTTAPILRVDDCLAALAEAGFQAAPGDPALRHPPAYTLTMPGVRGRVHLVLDFPETIVVLDHAPAALTDAFTSVVALQPIFHQQPIFHEVLSWQGYDQPADDWTASFDHRDGLVYRNIVGLGLSSFTATTRAGARQVGGACKALGLSRRGLFSREPTWERASEFPEMVAYPRSGPLEKRDLVVELTREGEHWLLSLVVRSCLGRRQILDAFDQALRARGVDDCVWSGNGLRDLAPRATVDPACEWLSVTAAMPGGPRTWA